MIRGFVVLLAMAAQPVWAETCRFTLECYEAETCQTTTFEIEIVGETLVTDAETIPVNTGGDGPRGTFVGFASGAMHMLTREKNGAARYVTHIFNDITQVSYQGTCSE